MRYEIHEPCERLRPYVLHLVISEADVASEYSVLPGTGLVMGFQYTGKLAHVEGREENPLATAGVTGLLDGYRLFRNVAGTGTILVHFREMGMAAFIRDPVNELFDLSLSLEHFFPRQAISDTQERLAAATQDSERLKIVEELLIEQLLTPTPDQLVKAAIGQIYESSGNLRIGELADRLHTSQGPLEKRFRRYVGASPKKFAGIVRFKHMMSALQQGRGYLDRMEYLDAYYDQAHFIKDFIRFTSMSPEEFLRAK